MGLAQQQRRSAAAGPTGLADALHGAPDLLAAVAAAGVPAGDLPRPWPRWRILRSVSKACCEAVDAATTRIRLDFDQARPQADAAGGGAWLARMERRLAKLPRLEELTCFGLCDTELGQLLAGPAAAGVQRLKMCGCTSGRSSHYEPGPSPAHLLTLQVRNSGWPLEHS